MSSKYDEYGDWDWTDLEPVTQDHYALKQSVFSASEHFREVVKILFGDGELDEHNLFEHIQELANHLDVLLPRVDLNVVRKNYKETQTLEAINYFNNYTRDQTIC